MVIIMWNGKKKAVTFSYDDGVEQEAEFKQCRKLLNAIGDENRQHLICLMMNMPIDGGLVLEIVEQTHHPGCHSLI